MVHDIDINVVMVAPEDRESACEIGREGHKRRGLGGVNVGGVNVDIGVKGLDCEASCRIRLTVKNAIGPWRQSQAAPPKWWH
jgi:hypothetical protein